MSNQRPLASNKGRSPLASLLLSAAATVVGMLLLYQLAVWFASGEASDFVARHLSGPPDVAPSKGPVQTASVQPSDPADPPGGAVSREGAPEPLAGSPPEVSAETLGRAPARVPDSTSSTAAPASPGLPDSRLPAASAARPEPAGPAAEEVPALPAQPVPPAESLPAPGGDVYRVQVAAAPDSAAARRTADRVEQVLGARVPVHVEIVPPYYKVRVGDFADRAAAGPLLGRLRDAGYPDAWIVESGGSPR